MKSDEPKEFVLNEISEGFAEAGRLCAQDGCKIAVYGPRTSRGYTYALYFWDLSDYEYFGEGFWSCCEAGGIYEELEQAKNDAERAIVAISG